VRPVRAADLPEVIDLDRRVTGLAKPDYWQEMFARHEGDRGHGRFFFLVAEGRAAGPPAAPILGFILGEVRAWEFGSEPCGWVIALSVEPNARLRGIGRALFAALEAAFAAAGAGRMRTMVARDNRLHLMFFRGEGMMAGPYLQLEKELD
jgi:GNAT superfamily N-acetyltransferase